MDAMRNDLEDVTKIIHRRREEDWNFYLKASNADKQ